MPPATCTASSRVGASTSPWVARDLGSTRSTSGRAKAAVLPVPVCAWPIRSRPASRRGTARAWIGVGASKPRAAIARSSSGDSPSSSNVGGISGGPSSTAAGGGGAGAEGRGRSYRGLAARGFEGGAVGGFFTANL